MNIGTLQKVLNADSQYQQLKEYLTKPTFDIRLQILSEATPFTLSTIVQELRQPMLVVVPNPDKARWIHEQISIWCGNKVPVLLFPESEALPFEMLTSQQDITHQRITTLSSLIQNPSQTSIIVASVLALSQKTIGKNNFQTNSHTLHIDQNIKLKEILGQWQIMGYKFEPLVTTPGHASHRGGIVDIFSPNSDLPSRIELWGNKIESIRFFDPTTQISNSVVDSVTIIPALETLPKLSIKDILSKQVKSIDLSKCTEKTRERLRQDLNLILEGGEIEDLDFYSGFFNKGSLLDYFPENGCITMCQPQEINESAIRIEQNTKKLRVLKEQRGELPPKFPSSHLKWSKVVKTTSRRPRIIETTRWGVPNMNSRPDSLTLPFSITPLFNGKLNEFVDKVKNMASYKDVVIIISSLPKRLTEVLIEHQVDIVKADSQYVSPMPGSIFVIQNNEMGLRNGWTMSADNQKIVIFSDTEIFGTHKQNRIRTKTRYPKPISAEFQKGDLVVHVKHGIAKFIGTGQALNDESNKEYLILKYADKDSLYVPMDHFNRVTRYIGPVGHNPKLNRLGGQEWNRAKKRAELSTREMTAELLSLYAAREIATGHSSMPDTPWQKELEDSFPYYETDDQNTAISEVKIDMEQNRPMDRLICGDVGYGKTEVALRAAFKTVMDGSQVALLVPTTVLAQQHFSTFSERLKPFPVKIAMLSRFRTQSDQSDIIKSLASNEIDICIGTHRLVQSDVKFKNLGLVIIDEEQRFGVSHKEKLKQMRNEVDVLTMSATPIPRTLNMSLAGIRDMSRINTPPEERLPIKTYVSELSDDLVKEAIRREMDRQGQVFFVHNRVKTIDQTAHHIQSLVPEAKVAIGHGQMPEDQLEKSMVNFASGKADVLICTTIIESGLDIPNANTIIIDRADTFGLAQLYQLRGRVGRGTKLAYAYLLIPSNKTISQIAEHRLKTMLAATELGEGFQIAMRDLEIRGTGNILGTEQSGHMHALGFDLYTNLLEKAANTIRAEKKCGNLNREKNTPAENRGYLTENETIVVNLSIPANIPEKYIPDLTTRLSIYRKMVEIHSPCDAKKMAQELLDRFGHLPCELKNLLKIAEIKSIGIRAGIQSITQNDKMIILKFRDLIGNRKHDIENLLGPNVVVGQTQVRILAREATNNSEINLIETLEKLSKFATRRRL